MYIRVIPWLIIFLTAALLLYAIVAENFVISALADRLGRLAKLLPQRLEDTKNLEVLNKRY